MCPDCQEPLVIFELEGVEVDHCMSCSGTWLDGGELEMFSELSGVHAGKITEALFSASSTGKRQRRCPRCRKKLQIIFLNASSDERIELDRCPRGHGIWLDKGEMLHIIDTFKNSSGQDNSNQASESAEEGAVAQFFSNLYENELEIKERGK